MKHSTGDIIKNKNGLFVYVASEDYHKFKDGIIKILLKELKEPENGYKLIPSQGLIDSELEDMSDAIGIIAGEVLVDKDMTDNRDWVARMILMSRYLESRRLLQVMLPGFDSKNYKHIDLLYWFVISYNDETWEFDTTITKDMSYIYDGAIHEVILGYYHNIPASLDGLETLFGMCGSELMHWIDGGITEIYSERTGRRYHPTVEKYLHYYANDIGEFNMGRIGS